MGWLVFGGDSSGSAASFQVSPGIPPVLFDYLDNVHIASYLAQLQGGAATTGSLSQESTATKNASVGANGAGLGASSSRQSAAELSLTVTNQSRFTSLLGLLKANGYLHSIDMAAPNPVIRREFRAVTPGSFVQLSNCTLTLPSYVQSEQVWRAAKGRINPEAVIERSGESRLEELARESAIRDTFEAKYPNRKPPGLSLVGGVIYIPPAKLRLARKQMNQLVRRVGQNPRVPLSSCGPFFDPYTPDLLMPIRLAQFSSSQSALAGRLTLVGKVLLVVRKQGDDYVDLASLQQWSGARFWTDGADGLSSDVTVLAPGYVIQPIAIYK